MITALAMTLLGILPSAWTQTAPGTFITGPTVEWNGRLWAINDTTYAPNLGSNVWNSLDTGKTWTRVGSVGGIPKVQNLVPVGGPNGDLLIVTPPQAQSSYEPTKSSVYRLKRDGSVNPLGITLDPGQGVGSFYPSLAAQGNVAMGVLLTQSGYPTPSQELSVWISRDAGVHWESKKLCDSITCSLSYNLQNPTILFSGSLALVQAYDFVFLSNDSGKSWVKADSLQIGAEQLSQAGPNRWIVTGGGTAPKSLSFLQGQWKLDTLKQGWPNQANGKPVLSRQCTRIHDTVFVGAWNSLVRWDEVLKSWAPVSLGLPDSGFISSVWSDADRLFLGNSSQSYRREPNGSVLPVAGLGLPSRCGINALAWYQNQLIACGWGGCFRSPDSGVSWKNVSKGLEGDYVSWLRLLRGKLYAATLYTGVREFNGKSWIDAGNGGLPADVGLFQLEGKGDTLATVADWGYVGVWIQPSEGAKWEQISSSIGGWSPSLAWTDSGLYASQNDSVWIYQQGASWKLADPSSLAPYSVGGKLAYVTRSGSSSPSIRRPGSQVKEPMKGTVYNGSVLASHGSDLLALTDQGLNVFGNQTSFLPLPVQMSNWIGSVQVVGDRVFVGTISGLWTTDLPSAGIGVHPRSALAGPRSVRGGIEVVLDRNQSVQIDWLDAAGRTCASVHQDVAAGRHILSPKTPLHGFLWARVKVGESREVTLAAVRF